MRWSILMISEAKSSFLKLLNAADFSSAASFLLTNYLNFYPMNLPCICIQNRACKLTEAKHNNIIISYMEVPSCLKT
jgi:hypothetical protein